MDVDPDRACAGEGALGEGGELAPVEIGVAVVQAAAPEQRRAVGHRAHRVARFVRARADAVVVQIERVGGASVGEQEERLVPGQVAVEAGSVGEVVEPAAQPVRAAGRVVPLEEDMRVGVGRLAVGAAQLEAAGDQRLGAVEVVHLVIGERVPGEKPPVVAEGGREAVELVQHPLALLQAAAVEVRAQPLQDDRGVAGRLGEVLVDPFGGFRAAPRDRRAEDCDVAALAFAGALGESLRLARVLAGLRGLAAEEVKQRQLAARQRERGIGGDRRLQRLGHAGQIAEHPLDAVAVVRRGILGGRQRQPPTVGRPCSRHCFSAFRCPSLPEYRSDARTGCGVDGDHLAGDKARIGGQRDHRRADIGGLD